MATVAEQFLGTVQVDINDVDAAGATDLIALFDAAGIMTKGGALTAASIPLTAVAGLTATEVQAAIAELQAGQTVLEGLQVNDGNFAAVDPVAADGEDGESWVNYVTGDVFGPKAAGAWPASTQNIYSQLGFSAMLGQAPAAVGTNGVEALAARGDHVHPFQGAADTAVTAAATNYPTVGAPTAAAASVEQHLADIDAAIGAFAGPHVAAIAVGDWVAGATESVLTIAAATHGLTAAQVSEANVFNAAGVKLGVQTTINPASADVTFRVSAGSEFAGTVRIAN